MPKDTHEGYPKLSTASDVVHFLLRHPKVDKIKYGRMGMATGWYLSMWSIRHQQGFGNTVLSDKEFEKLKTTAEGPVIFEHTTQVIEVPR